MFSDDTFCWEDFPASGSCPELSTARADAKSKYDMIYFWLRSVSEGWRVGLWRFQRLQKEVGGGVFVSSAFTSSPRSLLLVRSGPCKLCGTRHQMLNMLVSDWLQTVLMWWLSRNCSDGNELLQKLKQRVHCLANFLLSFQWRNQTVLIVNFWTENLVLS